MRSKVLTTAAVAAAFALAGGAAAQAATVFVEPGDDLEAAVEGASAGDVVELKQGTHPVTCAAGTACIDIPDGVTIMADPAAPHGSVVVEGGDNTNRVQVFASGGTDITISGIRFVPDPNAPNGGRAVWVPAGGGDLTFNDNIVERFTDAVFARGQTSGSLEFLNNVVTLIDRDPASNSGFLGGNAAFTVLIADVDAVEAAGNVVHGPGRNVDRFIAVTGIIIFNFAGFVIDDIDIWNNAVSNVDFAIFSSGGVTNTADIAENRLHTNGAGIAVAQVPPPDITDPTPAENTNLLQNRISGNDFGVIIDTNAEDTFLDRNQIAGNPGAAVLDLAAAGETTFGTNLIRGKDTGTPDVPPGRAFDPVTGSVN